MIRIKNNNAPNLTKCKMLCDEPLHEKLNEYELSSFLNSHSTNLLIGKPRSGKTSLLYSFFKSPKLLRKVYHNIFLFQPSQSRASMKDKIFDKLPDDKKYDELNYENLSDVINRIKETDEDVNNCIIFDDMTAYLKNSETLQLLKELIFNHKHLHTSIFVLVQTYRSVPKEIRRLFSNVFVFRVTKNELETIFEELIEQKADLVFLPILKLVYDKPYNFLFINTDSQRLFKNWHELLINDNDDNFEIV